jgi:hypothetical protein
MGWEGRTNLVPAPLVIISMSQPGYPRGHSCIQAEPASILPSEDFVAILDKD